MISEKYEAVSCSLERLGGMRYVGTVKRNKTVLDADHFDIFQIQFEPTTGEGTDAEDGGDADIFAVFVFFTLNPTVDANGLETFSKMRPIQVLQH